jgi:hypothetical protein
MRETFDPLTEQGQKRREEILQQARNWARGRRVRRRVTRGGVVAVLLIGLAILLLKPTQTHRRDPIEEVRTTLPSSNRSTEPVVTRIVTEHGLADRLAVKIDGASVSRLTDEQLLDRLAEGGRPAAVAYVDGREIVLRGAPLRKEQ